MTLHNLRGFNTLSLSQGNLMYIFLVFFGLLSFIQVIFLGHFDRSQLNLRRMTRFIYILLGIHLLLLMSFILVWTGLVHSRVLLPPIERCVDAIILLLFVRFLLIANDHKRIRIVFICAIAFILLLTIFTYFAWQRIPASVNFNDTYLDWIWSGLNILICSASLIWLLIKRVDNWKFHTLIFSLFLLAGIFQLLGLSAGYDDPIAFRWASMIIFPLLVILTREFTPITKVLHLPVEPPPLALAVEKGEPNTGKISQSWASLSANTDNSKTPFLISKAFSHSLKSDLTYFVSSEATGSQIKLNGGYNLIRETEAPRATLEKKNLPILANALKNQELIEISTQNSISNDLQNLTRSLHLNNASHVLFVPLVIYKDQQFGLILLTPFSRKEWTKSDLDTSVSLANEITPVVLEFLKSIQLEKTRFQVSETNIEGSTSIIQRLENENKILKTELESYRIQHTINDDQEKPQPPMDTMPQPSESLKKESSASESDHLEMELRLTLEEIARLQNSLAEANIQIHHLQNQIDQPPDTNDEVREVIDSVVQELRQPMTSIIGYVDLFVSESAGSLNAMQKKFIDRVQASIERMQILMDDLIQTTNLQKNHLEINPDSMDVNEVIDQALLSVAGQIREKNITLRIDVPRKLASIIADRNSVKQILVRLLFNACTVTPNDQTIIFRVKLEGNPKDLTQTKSLRIQVTDSGGGVSPEELPNVFNRQYRADKPLLKGIGDTGIGLTIARLLIEAHGGNIWIESDPGKTSTINVLLPAKPPDRETTQA